MNNTLLSRRPLTLISRRGLFGLRKEQSKSLIAKEKKFVANTYDSADVVFSRGKGAKVWDVDGKEYLDFLGGYAALNMGHCHPKLVKCVQEQVATLHHSSRAFYNNQLVAFAEYATEYFGYDKLIPMNSGCEAVETAVKVARRWGYLTKGIPESNALVVTVENNFWGRSLAALSSSTNPKMYEHFGPYTPGFGLIPYDNLCALEDVVKNPNVCAFLVEPIQGEAGVIIPCDGYLKEVRRICTENKVLWIADEVQTGLGRTGALLAVDHEGVRPDILVLGKAISGGVIPVSAVFADEQIMGHMTHGSHGSTFGGNPLGCRVATVALQVLLDECLIENSLHLGNKFRAELTCRLPKAVVPEIRGKGLMNAIEICPDYGKAKDVLKKMRELGLLAKDCNETTIRFTPPLNILERDVCKAVDIISEAVHFISSGKII